MSREQTIRGREAMQEAAERLQEAALARKCWSCGCLHDSLAALERALPPEHRSAELDVAMGVARNRLMEVRYDCLGCEICYPALALNALNEQAGAPWGALETCPTGKPEEREGWPPLPGSYTVLRYHAPVAVCTLTDDGLWAAVAAQAPPQLAIAGTLQTENLGIERLILNVLANPNIRFLILCGADSRQAIGHLPGQSLVALARSGLDGRSRIIGARGKRPVLRNISREAVEHFRRTIEVSDLVGRTDVVSILDAAHDWAGRDPGPAVPFQADPVVTPVEGYGPERTTLDPAGYFVVYADHRRGRLVLEHYRNSGVLDVIIEGHTAAELYHPAVERCLVSRLDHAAYLGRELARAEEALRSGSPYIQEAASERYRPLSSDSSCDCPSSCGGTPP